jgi:hypothetical protein
MAAIDGKPSEIANGAALAAVMAAGVGAFAVGLVVIINEAGLFSVPALYRPAGGVSGRTTLAAVIWLIGWAVLHGRWRNRQLEPGRVYLITMILVSLGTLLTLPPVWKLF